MKHMVRMIVHGDGENSEIFRKDWEMPNVSAEEFDVHTYQTEMFRFPPSSSSDFTKGAFNTVFIWQTCTPENDEEKDLLIKMGKWGLSCIR